MRTILSICLLLALQAPARAEEPSKLFARANEDYRQGRHAAAAEGYRELLELGYASGPVYYNLGNAYQKLGDAGRARAAYENALERMPRDAALRQNLSELIKALPDKPTAPSQLEWLGSFFSRTELTVLASLFYWVGAGLWLSQLRRRTVWRTALLAGCAFGLLFFGGLWAARERSEPGAPAVVLPAEVSLFEGPGRDFEAGLKLHAGSLVYVLGERGDWREVAAMGQVRGWLRAEELELLNRD